MKILIVDDREDNVYMLKTFLEGSGFEVAAAGNGEDALAVMEAEKIDLIISDILMPKMDGFQLCRKVKSEGTLKNIPFAFYTASYTDDRDEELAMKIGADIFIRQPVEPSELLEIIRDLIEKSRDGKIQSKRPVQEESEDVLKLYNERLVSKLEQKMADLKREISERKKAEHERDYLFNLSLDMLCIAGFDGYFRQLNPEWEKVLGWPREELMSKPFLEFVHPDDRQPSVIAMQALSDGKEVRNFETRYLSKDGPFRWISWNCFPMVEEKLVLGVARDITEQKKVQKELQKRIKELEEFYDIAIGRELKMIELKNEISELKNRLAKYEAVEEE